MIYLKPLVRKLIGDSVLAEKVKMLKTDKEMLSSLLTKVSTEDLKSAFSHHYGIDYVPVNEEIVSRELIENFDIEFLESEMVLPHKFEVQKQRWHFAISDLTDRNIQQKIRKAVRHKGHSVSFAFSFEHEIKDIFNHLENEEDGFELTEEVSSDAVSWVDTIINNGIRMKASDIHIEREKKGLRVRYRVDGSMTRKRRFEMSESGVSNIYVRLKLIGNMDISEKRRSQDGRIDHYEYEGAMYSLRVSTVNTIHGEKFVMRVFSESEETESFEELGFTTEQERKVSSMINKSNGIIYLAGATGSGKTTTLYAMINKLNKDTLNIYTIESPVEKGIEGVNQIQIDEASGNTYPSTLEALLRQDPDIMVVGEIREAETAKLAVQSSLTGHLVMTTIHANSALDSISRLVDMGVENYLIGASSVGFISQRLVRVLCPHCKKKVDSIPEHERIWVEKAVGNSVNLDDRNNSIYEAIGCDECVDGYEGRVAVLEIIEVDNNLKAMISKGVSTEEIADHLMKSGYKDMKQDGVDKMLNGQTSVQELISKLQN